MTPERWRQIDDLFAAAVRLDPAERGDWLRRTCGHDDDLCAEVARLLAQDEAAAHDGFLSPPVLPMSPVRPASVRPPAPNPAHPIDLGGDDHEDGRGDAPGDFALKAAIAAGSGSSISTGRAAEARTVVRERCRELAIIYLLIFGMGFFWRHAVMRRHDPTLTTVYLIVLTVLVAIAALLYSRRPLSLRQIRFLELGMIGILAGRVSFSLYWTMLTYSLRHDPLSAQRVMQNNVLMTSILILTSGIYVPKGWRRAAAIAGVLAMLPFATLLALYLQHPAEMGWLVQRSPASGNSPLDRYGYDVILLMILALGSSWGAYTIHRLRMQVVEARQLGQYRLRRQIGSGGMGEVYLADHQLLKRPCALKLIRPGNAADLKTLERFEREVRITARLSHWNTVEIFDYGRTKDGTYYYVMEYLPGLNLADLVGHHGPLPPGRVVYLLRQVCLALREAHAAGLIHRDIKPSNIFAARRGGLDDVAKLLDFGLVLPLAQRHTAEQGGEVQILGTPLYMSPEQARGGRELDERSDIYSLGTVAYFLLSGRPPFDEGGGIEALIAHTYDPVVPPSQLRDDIPEDLERVVLRCLAKEPGDRYPDADSLEHRAGRLRLRGRLGSGPRRSLVA